MVPKAATGTGDGTDWDIKDELKLLRLLTMFGKNPNTLARLIGSHV